MAIKWTDATKVKARMKSGTSLTNAEIEKFIEENEAYLEVWLKDTTVSLPTSPDLITNKAHLFGSKIVEMMTVLDVVMTTPMSFRTLEEAYLAANISKDQLDMYKQLLNEKGVTDFVKKGGS